MSPRRSERLLPVIALGGLLAAGSAWALKTDKNQPINVHSDRGDFQADPQNNSNGTGIYTGHVVITQGSIVINADKAVFHVVDNNLDTAHIEGNPATFVQQPDQGFPMHGQSQEMEYDVPHSQILLMGQARLTQQVATRAAPVSTRTVPAAATIAGGTVVNRIVVPGERLVTAKVIHYDTDTQHVVAGSSDDVEQRVHVSFPPKVAAPAPATPAAGNSKQALPPPAPGNRAAPTVLMPRPASTTAAAAPAAATAQAPAAGSHSGPP